MMNLRSRDRVVGNAELADRLCAGSNDLRAAHARHVATHGTLIPHAFMGEVLARAGACVAKDAASARSRRTELDGILATLELALAGGDRETCSVVCISFVWDAESEPFFAALRPLLGPLLGACVRQRTDDRGRVAYLASSSMRLINNTGEHP
jgi:hypothetical protein